MADDYTSSGSGSGANQIRAGVGMAAGHSTVAGTGRALSGSGGSGSYFAIQYGTRHVKAYPITEGELSELGTSLVAVSSMPHE